MAQVAGVPVQHAAWKEPTVKIISVTIMITILIVNVYLFPPLNSDF